MFGIKFDCRLSMHAAICELAQSAKCKLVMILRSRRYYNDAELIGLYKAHVMSFVENRTAAIYHATNTELKSVNRIQRGFLRDLGVSEADAMIHFNLAPLCTRRDIAMLGVIHRTAIGKGPPQLKQFFRPAGNRISTRRHKYYLHHAMNGHFLEIARRSALGLVKIYNALPAALVDDACSVSTFQSRLQERVVAHLNEGDHTWAHLLSGK